MLDAVTTTTAEIMDNLVMKEYLMGIIRQEMVATEATMHCPTEILVVSFKLAKCGGSVRHFW